jgi:endonuclease/exonuclease/phosphatase family metal-dependent hydrolase
MQLITWNVQWCRGIDLVVDPARIVDEARRLADFDVLCLQEIADNYPDPRLGGSDGSDQFARLAALLPGYVAIPGIAVDQPGEAGRRRRFGNMILSRLPVAQVYRHLLPYPLDPDVPGMPRIAVEAVVRSAIGDVRIITTHLEYYSLKQRMAQVEALRRIYAEGHAYARDGHHRRLQLRARVGGVSPDAGALRRSHASARRRVARCASPDRASADVQDL